MPVKDLFLQIIDEVQPAYFFTVGTAGSVFDEFGLGDAVISRSAKFRLQQEFKNEPYNGTQYKSDWQYSTTWLSTAEALMANFTSQLTIPPFGLPTDQVALPGGQIPIPTHTPAIKIEQGARDMPEFHPILTTDYFEYGTTTNRLDLEGAAVEMGDAALGLACSELAVPPKWIAVRNMSDPVIDGTLPAKQFHLNEQTTWAVAYYTAYGEWTSATGASPRGRSSPASSNPSPELGPTVTNPHTPPIATSPSRQPRTQLKQRSARVAGAFTRTSPPPARPIRARPDSPAQRKGLGS